MSLNIGTETATLKLDISQYQQGISSAAEKYREFISENAQAIGFEGATKGLQELTSMINELAKLEDWSVEERIAGLESVQSLYEGNLRQQMQLELQIHSLKQQQEKEEEEALKKAQKEALEALQEQKRQIDGMNTGYAKTTDFAAMIAAYEELKEAAEGNAKLLAEIEDMIAKTAEQRKNKLTDIKKDEVDGLLKESERYFQANKVLQEDEQAYTIAFYQRQIELNRQMINTLAAQEGALTEEQDQELEKRLDAEAGYYAKIQQLVNEGYAERQKAEQAITEALEKELEARAGAQEAREKADAEYYARAAQTQQDAREKELQLLSDYEQAVLAVNERLVQDEQRLTESYEKAFAARQSSLMNFVGLFDSVKEKDVTGEDLLANLTGQLEAMKTFEASLQSLGSKGISEELYEQLQGLGAGRYAEVAALDSMTQEQLNAYQAIYDEKARIAREQTQAQMSEQQAQLSLDIQNLRVEATSQINQITADYEDRMYALNESTRQSLTKLTEDWQAALLNIEDGLKKEIDAQEAIIAKNNAVKSDYYKQDAAAQNKTEQDKTENVRTENKRQEQEVWNSQANNVATLREFLPEWAAVGLEYGDALLDGVRSTSSHIFSYLTSVADAVRAAQSGEASFGAYATGTNSAAQGLALVGENGPEIVDFSGGEQVVSFRNSMQLLSEGVSVLSSSLAAVDYYAGGNSFTPADTAIDYDKLARAVAAALPRQQQSIIYNPVYNSPQAASVAELRQQDKINMRRLGMSL